MKMMRKYLVLLCVLALAVSAMAISAAALETTRYEAEDAVYQASGMSSRDGAMTGFKDNPQAFVTFTVQSDKAGAQAVKILYSADGDCKLTVLANGSKAGEVSLRAGENQTAELSATLAKGDNKTTLWNEYGTIKAELKLKSIEVEGRTYSALETFYQTWSMNYDASHAGFSGSGFVAGFYMNCGAHVQFTVDVPADGEYDVTVGYANGNNEAKGQAAKLGVYVNGSKQKDTLLVPGQAWNTYLRKTEQLTLKKGTNTLTYWYEDTSVGAAPNFDYIEIAAKGTATDKDPTVKTVEELIAEHNETVLPFTVTPNKGMTMEAENALWVMGDPYKSIGEVNEHSGYTGSGFVAGLWDNAGSGVEFPLEVLYAGTYTMTIRYANGAGPAAVGIYVDGQLLDKYDIVSSGGWSSWSEFAIDIQLTEDSTSLKLQSEAGEGQFGINLDNISLTPVDVEVPEEETTEPSEDDDTVDSTDAPTVIPDNGSTNVEPEKDYTLVVVIGVAVAIAALAVVVIILAKKGRAKKA
jgi:hypothetical protein